MIKSRPCAIKSKGFVIRSRLCAIKSKELSIRSRLAAIKSKGFAIGSKLLPIRSAPSAIRSAPSAGSADNVASDPATTNRSSMLGSHVCVAYPSLKFLDEALS